MRISHLSRAVCLSLRREDIWNEVTVEDVKALVHPHDPTLIRLYFRIVHPSFPILHKNVFLEKYNRTYHEITPHLLAAVYALAVCWWSYDPDLLLQEKINEVARSFPPFIPEEDFKEESDHIKQFAGNVS
jgi:Fungal specific transcription factor domain